MQGTLVQPEKPFADKPTDLGEAINKQYPEGFFNLKMGSTEMLFPKKGLVDGVNVGNAIMIDHVKPIILKVKEGKLQVSTTVTDSDEKIVAQLEENEWTINPNKIFRRNYDDNAVEVIDEYGQVILFAELVSDDFVVVRGIFNASNVVVISSSETITFLTKLPASSSESQKTAWRDNYKRIVGQITKTFSYKGKDYLGKRNDVSNP